MKWKRLYIVVFTTLFTSCLFAQDWKQALDSASICKANGKLDEAVDYYLKAREFLKKDSLNSTTYIQASRSVADMYFDYRLFIKAATFYEEIREAIRKKNGIMNSDYAFVCNRLGAAYNEAGMLDTALAIHLQVKEIRQQLTGTTNNAYAQSCNNIGALYRDFGYYDLAEPLLLQAKEIREKLAPAGRNPFYAITCTALANLYRDMGKYNEAEALYIIAKKIRGEVDSLGKKHRDYAYSCNILADYYAYMRQYDKAEPLYQEAKQLREQNENEIYAYAETCNNLGALYREMGQFEKAKSLLLEAKIIFEKMDTEGPACLINYNNIGELYYAMGKYPESELYYLKARNKWGSKLGKEHPYYISNADQMTRLYRNMNLSEKANELIKETSALKYRQLSRVFEFTSEAEKGQYLKNINGSADEYLSFYFTNFRHENAGNPYDISVLNRNLILSSIQQMRRIVYDSNVPRLSEMFNDWTNARQQLARIFSRGASADTTKLKTLVDKVDRLEKELSSGSAAFKKKQTNPGWQDIRNNLQKNEAAIEFAAFQVYNRKSLTDSVFYVALLIHKELPEPVLVPLFNEKKLDSLLRMRNANSPQGINLNYNSGYLFKLIWQPIEKHLSGITKIYFAADGLLHKVSMAALRVNKNQVLSDKYQLIQLFSTAFAGRQTETKLSVKDKVILYGAVQFDADSAALAQSATKYQKGSFATRSVDKYAIENNTNNRFPFLPKSEEEIDTISKYASEKGMRSVSLKRTDANEESIQELSGDTTSFVLHLATHGFFNTAPSKKIPYTGNNLFTKVFENTDDPLFRTGLLFAGAENTSKNTPIKGVEDGVLTAYEISNMHFPHNKLTVLSACETALGDIDGNEGVYGLQRAFKMAGTESLIMSLWKVPDEQTTEFMKVFYKAIFNDISITDAFYRAQETMKKKYANEPNKWAGLILIK